MDPSEFWEMSPQEFWLLADEKQPEERIGSIRKSTFDRLGAMLDA